MSELILPSDATVLVASDMHIGEHDPDTARFFIGSLRAALSGYSHLILLGDLFEAWPGDDQTDSMACELVAHLARTSRLGQTVWVMRGNRDFLLDVPVPAAPMRRFGELTGARMLVDPTCLQVGDVRVALMHGDTLCTDDTQYQAIREQCRTAQWQQEFLSDPLTRRVEKARDYRAQSRARHNNQTLQRAAIMDVNQEAVDRVLSQTNCSVLLHGHTHRPDTHRWKIDGQPRIRYVLPDWNANAQRGGFVRISASGLATIALN